MGTDKKMIWDDCPQCAYKHLAAAYAEMTDKGAHCMWLDGEAIFAARAAIAMAEVRAGYLGNIDLAVGCLASAEIRAEYCHASMYRQVRMLLQLGRLEDADASLVRPTAGWAEAHIVEAMRELGELSEDGYPDFLGMEYEETADWLKKTLKHIRETYELGKAESDE